MKASAYLSLYCAVALLSTTGLFSNGIPLDSSSITFIRSVFAGIALVLFIRFTGGNILIKEKNAYAKVYGIGILMGLHWVTFFYAMQSASVAIGMLTLYTFPMMTVLIEPWFSKKVRSLLDIILVVIILIGFAIIISGNLSADQQDNTSLLLGITSGMASALLFTFRNLLQKYHCAHIKSDTLMLHQVLIIAVMMLAFIDIDSVAALPDIYWGLLIILGVVTTAVAHTLLVKSYKYFPAKSAAMVSCLQPVFGSILAWLILSESLSLATIVGGGIILSVAVFESTRAESVKVMG